MPAPECDGRRYDLNNRDERLQLIESSGLRITGTGEDAPNPVLRVTVYASHATVLPTSAQLIPARVAP